MEHATRHHKPGRELQAFAAFYGAATLGAVIIRTVFSFVVPAELFTKFTAITWLLSFLLAFAICAPVFDWFSRHAPSRAPQRAHQEVHLPKEQRV